MSPTDVIELAESPRTQTQPPEAPADSFAVGQDSPPAGVVAQIVRPGLMTSVFWTFSLAGVQIVAGLIFGLLAVSIALSAESRIMFGMIGVQSATLVFGLVAATVISSRSNSHLFRMAPIRGTHFLAVAGLVLPASYFSQTCYGFLLTAWTALVKRWPQLGVIDEVNTMAHLGGILEALPLGLLLVLIAVVPAIAEEIIFRGIIARGMTSRYGIVTGVIVTSLLFGLAHLHPVHGLAVVPLGLCMHMVYVATRSFLAPVLFHFLNNAFAVVIGRLQVSSEAVAATEAAPSLPWWVAAAAFFALAGTFYFLVRTRVRLRALDGAEWDGDFRSVESPVQEIRREYPRLTPGPLLTFAVACGGFYVALALGIATLTLRQSAGI